MKEVDVIVVLCSVSGLEEGRKIAGGLLERRLAACISIISGVESHYVWRGKREKSEECLLVIKAPAEVWPALKEAIRSLHSYECPEILRLEVTGGWPDYIRWVGSSCLGGEQDT
ncbi:MAG: divalent-cation tolerance protein CutA [Chthoniobacterales bacterium]|nr:divalent-cation tolerance protein CutA [Chthoniobacterales bacterium]